MAYGISALPPFASGAADAPPVPIREINLLRNPLRLESKAAAAFREQAAAAFNA